MLSEGKSKPDLLNSHLIAEAPICANFSDVASIITSHPTIPNVDFNRKNIIGFILNTTYDLNLDADNGITGVKQLSPKRL